MYVYKIMCLKCKKMSIVPFYSPIYSNFVFSCECGNSEHRVVAFIVYVP